MPYKKISILFFLIIIFSCNSENGENGKEEISDEILLGENIFDGKIQEEGIFEEEFEEDINFYVTVNEIPPQMNCSEPYLDNNLKSKNCRLLLPTKGFKIDVVFNSLRKNIDKKFFEIKVNVPIGNGKIPEGENIAKYFESAPYGLSFNVRDEFSFPEKKEVVVQLQYKKQNEIFIFDVMNFPPPLDPFPQVDNWLILFSMDFFSTSFSKTSDGKYLIKTENKPNGKEDFYEAFEIVGLFNENGKFNDKVKNMLLERIKKHLYKMFHLGENGEINENSVRIKLFFEGDDDAPDPLNFSPDGNFSMIGIGGDSIDEKHFGMAKIDWNNQKKENNAEEGYGVFVINIVRKVANDPLGRIIFDIFNPIGGKPFGLHPEDELILNGEKDLTDEGKIRYETFWTIMDLAPLGIAAVCAHEIGHSVGLVPKGAPPEGLFGGLKNLSFIEKPSDDYHIDTEGLNIMQTGAVTNPLDVLTSYPSFNLLNISYLRRQIIVTNGKI